MNPNLKPNALAPAPDSTTTDLGPKSGRFSVRSPYTRRAFLIGGAALAATGAVVYASCGKSVRSARLIVGIDDSGSTRQCLPGYIGITVGIVGQMEAGSDQVQVFRCDRATDQVFNQDAPADRQAFKETLIDRLVKHRPKMPETWPDRYWKRAATDADVAGRNGEVVAVALFSDGDRDNAGVASTATIRHAAEKMARNPAVTYVVVYGTNPENFDTVYDLFLPLGERMHVFGSDMVDTEPLLDALDSGRTELRTGGPHK